MACSARICLRCILAAVLYGLAGICLRRILAAVLYGIPDLYTGRLFSNSLVIGSMITLPSST